MKKIILSAIAIAAFTTVKGQLREKGAIEIIPQIGVSTSLYNGSNTDRFNFSSPYNWNDTYYFDFSSTSDHSSLPGVAFGVGADYFFNNRWSIRSGLFYQSMGSKINAVKDYKERITYLTLPVNANWHFGRTKRWNLNFGPSIGYLLSADGNGKDLKDKFNKTQIGFNAGIGYKIEITNQISILIDLQGVTSLLDIAKDADITIRNTYSSFNVGGVFKL